jgi:hypothetical protein
LHCWKYAPIVRGAGMSPALLSSLPIASETSIDVVSVEVAIAVFGG